MEKIQQRKSETNTGPHRPQELSHLYDNKGTKRTTSTWMQELSQYNFKIEYRPGKEGGKPDALTRREGDLPTAGDKRLTRNVGILLPKERYWDIPETEEIKLDIVGNNRIPRQERGRNTEGKQRRQRHPRHQEKLGRRK